MKNKCLISLLLISQLFHSSFAQGQNQEIIGIGVGMFSCGKYVDYFNKNNNEQLNLFFTWIW